MLPSPSVLISSKFQFHATVKFILPRPNPLPAGHWPCLLPSAGAFGGEHSMSDGMMKGRKEEKR